LPLEVGERRAAIGKSGASGLHVTEYVAGAAQEHDAVTCGIALVPLEFVVRDFNFRSAIDVRPLQRFVRAIVRDGDEGPALSNMDFIGPIGIGLAAASRPGTIAELRDPLRSTVQDRARLHPHSGTQEN
jgi:hypothetical protein